MLKYRFWLYEARSHLAAQAGFELMIPVSCPPKEGDGGRVPPDLASRFFPTLKHLRIGWKPCRFLSIGVFSKNNNSPKSEILQTPNTNDNKPEPSKKNSNAQAC